MAQQQSAADLLRERRQRYEQDESPASRQDAASLLADRRQSYENAQQEPTAQETPAQNNFLDTITRLRIAGLDTDEEKLAAIRQQYGENARYIPRYISDNPALNRRDVWSPNGIDFYPVEPVRGERIAAVFDSNVDMRNPGLAVGEIATDIGEFLSGDTNSLAAEAGLLAATRGGGRGISAVANLFARAGGPLRRAAAISGTAGVVGEASDQGLQYLTGVQRQSLAQQAGQVGVSGLFEAGGGALGDWVSRSVQGMSRGGFMQSTPEGQQAQQAMRRMAQEAGSNASLMPGQTTTSQLARRLTSQAATVGDKIPRSIDDQRRVVSDRLRRAVNEDDGTTAREVLMDAHDRVMSEMAQELGSLRNIPEDVSWEQAGDALIAGRQAYEEYSGELVNGLYETARGLDPENRVRFDASGVRQELDAVLSDLQRGVPQEPRYGVSESGELPTTQPSPDWQPRYAGLTPAERSALNEVVRGAANIDWSRATMDDLRLAMQSVGELSVGGKEGARLPQALATRLREAIRRASQNPINAPEGYSEAWRAATNAAAQRFEMLEKPQLGRLMTSANPFGEALYFADPSSASNLRVIRQAFEQGGERGAQQWERFRDGFKTYLMENTGDLPQLLEQYGGRNRGEALDILLTRSERQSVEELATRVTRLQETNLTQLADLERYSLPFVDELFSGNVPTRRVDALQNMLERAGGEGWKQSAAGRAMRGAVMMRVMRDVIEPVPGRINVSRVNVNKLRNQMDLIERRELNRFLTDADLVMLGRLEQVVPFIEQAATDIGGSIAGASQVAQVLDNPIKGAAGLLPYNAVSRLMTSRAFQDFATGRGASVPRSVDQTVQWLGRLTDDLILEEDDEADISRAIMFFQQDEALNQGQFSNYGNMGPM